MQKYRIKSYYIFQLDLALKDENGGDISSFISNGEWDLIGVYISEQNLFYVFHIFSLFQRSIS